MIKLISKLSDITIWGYSIIAIILWIFNYFQLDIIGIVNAMGLPPIFYGFTGFGVAMAKTSHVIIKWALNKAETRNTLLVATILNALKEQKELGNHFRDVVKVFIDNQNTQIDKQNKILEFEKILAEKNKSSELISDEVKEKLIQWIGDLNV